MLQKIRTASHFLSMGENENEKKSLSVFPEIVNERIFFCGRENNFSTVRELFRTCTKRERKLYWTTCLREALLYKQTKVAAWDDFYWKEYSFNNVSFTAIVCGIFVQMIWGIIFFDWIKKSSGLRIKLQKDSSFVIF